MSYRTISAAAALLAVIPALQAQTPAAAAAPVFEAVTIKPGEPGRTGKGFTMRGQEFVAVNTSLQDLIKFAYEVHPRQITGGPAWMDSQLFDVAGKLEMNNLPKPNEIRKMMQALLADRFKLAFHEQPQELSVYVIVPAKGENKLKAGDDPNGVPGLFLQVPGLLPATNASMADLAAVLQRLVMDRPVVDKSGLTGRFNFELRWIPDKTQFGGRGAAGAVPDPKAAPDIFRAFQEQLGLRLEAARAPIEVMAIDRAMKPSAN
jgi:uncharacterized protein (TIGR03435 family)